MVRLAALDTPRKQYAAGLLPSRRIFLCLALNLATSASVVTALLALPTADVAVARWQHPI